MSSEEEFDEFDGEMKRMREGIKNNDIARYQVSGWEDDNEGVEIDTDPHKDPQSQILWASEHGNFELVNQLLERDPLLVNSTDKDGYTPLHRACYNNNVQIVELLLNKNANISAETLDKWQPLHSACKWNNTECVAKLLEYGADVNACSTGGNTPLHLAASNTYGKDLLILLLMNPFIKAHVKNRSNETPADIARRSGTHYNLFEIVQENVNFI